MFSTFHFVIFLCLEPRPRLQAYCRVRHLHFDVHELWLKRQKKNQSRNRLVCHLVVRTAVHTV